MIKDSQQRYGSISKVLHWLMAFLIFWQMLKFFDRIDEGKHWVGETLVSWHISIGLLILVFIVFRLIWSASQRNHRPVQPSSIAMVVKIGHGLLYACMTLLPVTGIMVMLGGGHGLSAFGIELVAKGNEIGWAENIGDLHSPITWILATLVIGHIGAALFHHFIKRDDTLTRMI